MNKGLRIIVAGLIAGWALNSSCAIAAHCHVESFVEVTTEEIDMPNPFGCVDIHKESRWARYRHPLHTLRVRWEKYFEVYPDELDGFEATTLEKIRSAPVFYVDRKIRFEVYWGKMGSFYAPFISPFDQAGYVNFSGWAYGADLWTKDAMGDSHPLFYVDKRRSVLIDKLAQLPIFTPVHVWATVRSKSEGQAWLEVLGAEIIPETVLSETSLRHLALGHTQLNRKRYDLAVKALESSIRVQLPVRAELKAFTMLGRAYFELRMYRQARNALINAIIRDEQNINNLVLLARTDLLIARAEEGRQAAETAVLLDPANPEAHAELGLALAMLGDIPAGYKELDMAQKLARQNQLPEANRNRAKVALLEGKLALARDELNQAVIFRPTDVDLKLELGDVYLAMNTPADLEKARLEFTQARDLATQRPEPYYKLAAMLHSQAETLRREGKNDEANKVDEEALKMVEEGILKDEHFAPSYDLQIDILRSLNRIEQMHKALEKGSKMHGNEHLMNEHKFYQAQASGDWAAMEAAAQASLASRPTAAGHSRLGRVLLMRANPDTAGAAAAYEQAVKLSPNSSEDWAALGNIRVCFTGDYQGAEQALIQATTLDAKNAGAWRNLAVAKRHLGKADQAVSAADLALSLSPTPDSRVVSALTRWSRGTPDDRAAASKAVDEVIQSAQANEVEKAMARSIRGAALLHNEKVDEALIEFASAESALKDNYEQHLWHGTALLRKGDIEEAAKHLEMARSQSAEKRAQSQIAAGVNAAAEKALDDVKSQRAAKAPAALPSPTAPDTAKPDAVKPSVTVPEPVDPK